MISRLDTISACDGQTDRRTDRQQTPHDAIDCAVQSVERVKKLPTNEPSKQREGLRNTNPST